MKLNDFVAAYIEKSVAMNRDYTGERGWVPLTNIILRDMESRGFCQLNQKKEVGLEVDGHYWITLPANFRAALELYSGFEGNGIGFSFVNGKMKTDLRINKKESPDTFVLSSWSATGVSITSSTIKDDFYNRYLLVVTNGDLSGRTFIIEDTAASAGGKSALSFQYAQEFLTSTSTAGYLTNWYVVLQYMAMFTVMSGSSDLVPIPDSYFNAIITGLYREATAIADTNYKKRADAYEDAILQLGNIEFTPTEDQARPDPRPMPGLTGCRHHNHKVPYPTRYVL
jgi:hypothetical protein